MEKPKPESPRIQAIRSILEEAKSNPLSFEERKQKSIEIASFILTESMKTQTRKEKAVQAELSRMMHDPIGKAFTTSMTDECFRSKKTKRIADQLIYLLEVFGIPKFLGWKKRISLYLFRSFAAKFPQLLVPIAIHSLRTETSSVIIPGEKRALSAHIQRRREEGVRLNINHLGEAILGEQEAERRLNIYLDDLARGDIDYVSIKISTICSQLNLLAWDETLEILSDRLRELYRAVMKHPVLRRSGERRAKFVNLDMEEYRDLHLTKDLFIKVLSEPEFHKLSAGIVLQCYLPDSHILQKELTEWAMNRINQGGAPIKIRLVKGANMTMEQFESSLHNWPQAPFQNKVDTDANYKKMVNYAFQPEHAKAVNIGVASHNLFDIGYAMLLRVENDIEDHVIFEMLEGMADHMRRVVQRVTGDILLYCAVATKKDFQSAIAYLIRRLDENTGVDNFLSHSFGLRVDTKEWDHQVQFFSESCDKMHEIIDAPRKHQNRMEAPSAPRHVSYFDNEPDTDFSLAINQTWAKGIREKWEHKSIDPIPLVIAGNEIHQNPPEGKGFDPSRRESPLYQFSIATQEQVDQALNHAKESAVSWSQVSIEERCNIVTNVAQKIREHRGDLIGAMIADGGKIVTEADVEISEAIDFCEYYLRCLRSYGRYADLNFGPKGTILVTSPWNFPVAIPIGGIIAALLGGNTVIFKPASQSMLAGWEATKILWEGGIPKSALQFLTCVNDPVGSNLIKDPRVNGVILTGATSTAQLFLKMRPGLELCAETGGKNAMIITSLADRDLAIKNLVHSAFGHNGQKCSAASLAVLEKEIYNDRHFRQQLKDAAASLRCGSAWNSTSHVTPLIMPPSEHLQRALTKLDQGESWLLKPEQHPDFPNLWSPGIKMGVKPGSYSHQTEFFGPLLSLIKADDLDHAIQIVNNTPYGLTSGIQSLDEREQKQWEQTIIAGNYYINRGVTGAVVRRQPFGGTKNSSFGHGSKAGGPNYIAQFMKIEQNGIPKEKYPVNDWVNNLSRLLEKVDLSAEELGVWYASIANYAFWWNRFKRDQDKSKIVGQDNLLRYKQHKKVHFRINPEDSPIDFIRVFAAALTCDTHLEVSWEKPPQKILTRVNWQALLPIFNILDEDETTFIDKMKGDKIKRLRMISQPSQAITNVSSEISCYINQSPVLANGRFELLHYLREVSISTDYHRYGNLGLREGELRKPVL